VRHLSKILLHDLDERYVPTECGKVQYIPLPSREGEVFPTGKYNRYIHLHPFMFFSAFLDPRMKVKLKKIMNLENYNEMVRDVLGEMKKIDLAADREKIVIPAAASKTKRNISVFDGFDSEDEIDDSTTKCEIELDGYKHGSVSLPLYSSNGEFNNPLDWWKLEGESKFPKLAKLAKKYLCIPATSAPSERVWSRASRILSMKRSRMKDDVAAAIMFTKENVRILNKHYKKVTGKEDTPILPMIEDDVLGVDDVGQGDV